LLIFFLKKRMFWLVTTLEVF